MPFINKIDIAPPTIDDIPAIIALAHETWQNTYINIIAQDQIDFMLQRFYSHELISLQLQNVQHFFFKATQNNSLLGYSHCYEENEFIKLSKLYIHPQSQGKGIGKLLLVAIEDKMKLLNKHTLILNVNRANPALQFYLKMGFEITHSVDIPLENFWLNDYIMQKEVIPI